MKLILLLIFILAAICRLPLYSVHWLVTVLRMLSSGAGVTSWPLVILSPHGTLCWAHRGNKLTHLSSQIEKTTVLAIEISNSHSHSYSFIDFDAYMELMCFTAPVYFSVQSANNM